MNAKVKLGIVRVVFVVGTVLAVILATRTPDLPEPEDPSQTPEARRQLRESFGIVSDGTSPFVALPSILVHDVRAARLGATLFSDYRVGRTSKCTCAACHWLNTGGTDGQLHAGVLTRPVVNAVFSSRFLQDGSLTNLTDVIAQMITRPAWADGGSPAQAAKRLAKDAGIAARFRNVFAGNGPNETNLVYCLEQYLRTQVTTGCALDLYEGGNVNALTPQQKRGRELFVSRHCITCHDGLALGGRRVSGGRRVPPLRGVTKRRVYLTDGSATDLAAVLPRMPRTDLSDDDRAALLAFLRAL